MLKLKSFIWLALLCVSCNNVNCDSIARSLLSKECIMVVKKLPGSGRYFNIQGINPKTGEWVNYVDTNSWYVEFNQDISVGDTVVKQQGSLKFYIHKRDTVLVFPYECGGKVYE